MPAPSIVQQIISKLEDKNLLILGFGLEGQSTYRFIRRHLPNQHITIADQNELKANPLLTEDQNLTLISGPNYLNHLEYYDLILKSPGISFKNVDYSNFQDKITSELELILEVNRENIIGITGTKGKSTTSSLVYAILQANHHDSRLLGNIGTPIFDEIEHISPETLLVLEMSSHQLEFIKTSPHIGAILNLFEDHLDAAGSVEHYHWSKLNLFRHMTKNDLAIYCADNPALQQHMLNDNFRAQLISISTDSEIAANVELRNGQVYCHETPLYDIANDRHLLGQHNLENIMVALTITHFLGLDPKTSQTAVNNFQPLEHRLEKVATVDNITYYNDVIATIPAATINAVKSLGNVDTLIFGGLDRGIDYTDFIDFLESSNINHFICMPSTGHSIGQQLDSQKTHFVDTLEEAVALASKITAKNSTCLLSPAAASYEFYKNFQEKGRAYKQLIHQLASGKQLTNQKQLTDRTENTAPNATSKGQYA